MNNTTENRKQSSLSNCFNHTLLCWKQKTGFLSGQQLVPFLHLCWGNIALLFTFFHIHHLILLNGKYISSCIVDRIGEASTASEAFLKTESNVLSLGLLLILPLPGTLTIWHSLLPCLSGLAVTNMIFTKHWSQNYEKYFCGLPVWVRLMLVMWHTKSTTQEEALQLFSIARVLIFPNVVSRTS